LIQIDGSPHDWYERRAPRCALIVFIDDATGRLTALRFAPAETTRMPQALDDELARREERVLSKALTFRSCGTMYCVKTAGPGTALRGEKVTLHHFPGGALTVHYKDRILPVTAYGGYPVPDRAARRAGVLDERRDDAVGLLSGVHQG
jgi:hypothetical protein